MTEIVWLLSSSYEIAANGNVLPSASVARIPSIYTQPPSSPPVYRPAYTAFVTISPVCGACSAISPAIFFKLLSTLITTPVAAVVCPARSLTVSFSVTASPSANIPVSSTPKSAVSRFSLPLATVTALPFSPVAVSSHASSACASFAVPVTFTIPFTRSPLMGCRSFASGAVVSRQMYAVCSPAFPALSVYRNTTGCFPSESARTSSVFVPSGFKISNGFGISPSTAYVNVFKPEPSSFNPVQPSSAFSASFHSDGVTVSVSSVGGVTSRPIWAVPASPSLPATSVARTAIRCVPSESDAAASSIVPFDSLLPVSCHAPSSTRYSIFPIPLDCSSMSDHVTNTVCSVVHSAGTVFTCGALGAVRSSEKAAPCGTPSFPSLSTPRRYTVCVPSTSVLTSSVYVPDAMREPVSCQFSKLSTLY